MTRRALIPLGAAMTLALTLTALPAQDMAPPAPAADAGATAPADTSTDSVAKAVAVPASRFNIPPHNPALDKDYIGHRYHEAGDTGGWGWVKLPEQSWNRAKWVAVKETPGVAAQPFRSMGDGKNRDVDQDYEFKMRGYFAPFQVYDPHTDEMLDVFVLEACEPFGSEPAMPLDLRPGPGERHHGLARSTFSSRGSE